MDINALQKKLAEVTEQAPRMGHHDETKYKLLYYDEVMYLLEEAMNSKDTPWQMSEAIGEVAKIIQNKATMVQITWDTITK